MLPMLPICTDIRVVFEGERHANGYFQGNAGATCDTDCGVEALLG